MLPGHLASVIKGLELAEHAAQIGLLAGPVRVIDEHSSPVPDSVVDPGGKVVSGVMPRALEFLGFPPGDFADLLRQENPLRCSAVVTNCAAHADVGGFDPSYRYVVDWEFWYRLSPSMPFRGSFTKPPSWSVGTRPARPTASRRALTTWRKPLDFWTPSSSKRITESPPQRDADGRRIDV